MDAAAADDHVVHHARDVPRSGARDGKVLRRTCTRKFYSFIAKAQR